MLKADADALSLRTAKIGSILASSVQKKSLAMDRKKFIITSSLAVFGLSTFGKVIRKDDQTFEGDCVTTNDILGPFYRPDSPRRSDLTYAGLEGIPINIMGQVFSSDCITPISEAMIEI